MRFERLTAIVRRSRLEAIEDRLVECGVGGVTVTPVQGFGEHTDFFSPDPKVDHVQLQIYTAADRTDQYAEAIREVAHTGRPGDGLVVIEPVDRVVRIRTGDVTRGDELHEPCDCPPRKEDPHA